MPLSQFSEPEEEPMPPQFQLVHLDYILKDDVRYGETFRQLQAAINNLAAQNASAPEGLPDPPAAPSALVVTAAGGIFDVAITDNTPEQTGIAPDYFLEYSTTPSFGTPTVVYLGPTRNWRRSLGNQTLYFLCYSQFGRASQPSPKVYFGSATTPIPVIGGGSTSGPAPQPSTGSGTGPTNGQGGGGGYGYKPVRNTPAGQRELR
jgi:hypothetical protein